MAQDFSDSPFPDAYDTPSRSLGPSLGGVLPKLTKDMRFVGIFSIVYGGLSCLTIIGALVGVPYIIMGLRLRTAADEFKTVQREDRIDPDALRRALEKQRSYFFINKVLIIVGIAFFVLYIGLIVLGLSAGIFWSPQSGA